MDVVRQRLQRRHVDDLRRIGKRALETLPHEIVDRRQKGRERLARSRRRGDEGWRPALIAGHASACAGVGAAKFSANQFATAGWNSVRKAAGSRDAAWRRREVARAAVVEARSVSKRLGSPGDAQEWRPASYIGRRVELWRPRRARLPNAATWARLGPSDNPGKQK